jgi:hypothetical protein
MAIAGVASSAMFSSEVGTIGTSWTFSTTQTFSPPRNILAVPLLRYISESDDQTTTEAYVSEFIDNGVKKTVHFMGVAATKCTSITWSLYCNRSFNNPTKLIFFF